MENKTSKYFKYAIGEVFLVVIGIIIALQLNNWNENRLNSNKETAILENINKEFKKNKKQLDSVVNKHKRAHRYSAKIISLFPIQIKPEQSVLDSLAVQLFWSYGGHTFNPSQTSINALASTSSFDIIKNETLRDLLISWNDLIMDYQEEEESFKAFASGRYDTYMSKHFDWNYNFKDERNDFDALQTLEFEFLIQNNFDLVDQILYTSGELEIVQQTLDEIILLSETKNN